LPELGHLVSVTVIVEIYGALRKRIVLEILEVVFIMRKLREWQLLLGE
jgi:hypothetical protein